MPNILKWPELGSSSKRFGDVHFVKVTSAERQWRNISDGELDVQNTTNVLATKTVESGSGVVIEVESQSPVSCIGSDGIDSATVDGVFISVPGSWKRISYKQTFLETQKCFAFFGSVPNWATGIFTPGVSEFDLSLDELWKEEYLGPNGNHFDGVNTLCGDEHFWMVNHPNTPVAGVSLRRKGNGSSAGISTFGKCGKFKFKISDIGVLQ
ncbi:uncharacterized protein LOC111330134 [Stylophora pistillata]|uniref:uncharacterized protein LOC111330134 n=1 Tax=Stylophora pistillata TaxID=50429 RepID=UPI000C056EB1|nr:uncharacterized protein LOC111330134 [Stylophora pistillata]